MVSAELEHHPAAIPDHEVHRYGVQQLPLFAKELLAGGVAGGMGKTIVAPLERVKILFQTGRMQDGGVLRTLRHIQETEGIRGFFKGNGASVARIVPYAAVHFSAYEWYRQALVDRVAPRGGSGGPGSAATPPSPVWDLLAGSAAGGTAVLATYPLDLVRTRLAYMTEDGGRQALRHSGSPAAAAAAAAPSSAPTAGSAPPSPLQRPAGMSQHFSSAASGPLQRSSTATGASARLPSQPLSAAQRLTIRSMLATTFHREGLRGLYHGIGPTLVGIVPYAGLKFYVYQSLKQRYRQYSVVPEGTAAPRLPIQFMLGFGAVSGLVAQTVTYPLDVVRRRMQVEGLRQLVGQGPSSEPFRNTLHGLVSIYQERGLRALFAGLSINYMKVVPSTAIGFTLYDAMKSYLGLPSNL